MHIREVGTFDDPRHDFGRRKIVRAGEAEGGRRRLANRSAPSLQIARVSLYVPAPIGDFEPTVFTWIRFVEGLSCFDSVEANKCIAWHLDLLLNEVRPEGRP